MITRYEKQKEYNKRTKYAAQTKYEKNNAVRYSLKFIRSTEADIIKKLESVENKSGYIKSLIRKDIQENEPL